MQLPTTGEVPELVPDSTVESFTTPQSPTSSGDESQTTSEKMPRRPPSAGKGFQFKRPELDLSAMLNLEQTRQLQILMTTILDDIQTQVRDNFEKMTIPQLKPTEGITAPKMVVLSVPNPGSEKYRSQYGDIGIPVERPDFDDRELLLQIMKPHPINKYAKNKPALTLPKTPEETIASSSKTEDELAIASLTELKRDALGHFAKWRGLVYKRMQEIVIKNGGTGGNVVRPGPQQPPGNARRVGFTARGSSARPAVSPPKNSEASNAQHIKLHPPIYTALRNLPKEKRALILHTMLLIFLGLDQYPTYARIALIKLATAMEVPTYVLLQDEYRVSQALAQIIKDIPPEEVAQKRAEEGKSAKKWRANGTYSSPGSSSNDLAEPLVAAGIGTVFGGVGHSTSVTATLLAGIGSADSTVPVGTLFGLYGARQGGKTMDAFAKDIQDLALVQMHGSPQPELVDPKDVPADNRRMRVTIGVNGWTIEDDDFRCHWKVFGGLNEVYALRWELETLSKVGIALQTVVKSTAWSNAKKEIAGRNVFDSLKTSHWPESLVKASKIVDNPWTVAMVRAEKTGLSLAEILNSKVQGERPVSLVGYGIGARVIYACLTCLSEKRAFGIVENVLLFGAPCPTETRVWAAMKSVVGGRLINVYSKNDYLLGFLYRSCAWNFGVAGLQPIEGVPQVENLDLSDTISDHLQYQNHIEEVLVQLRWEDVDYVKTNKAPPESSSGMSQMHGIVGGRVNKFPQELAERNRNMTKDPETAHSHNDKLIAKQQTGKTEPKDKLMPKQSNSKGKQVANMGFHHAHTRTEQENISLRPRQGHMEGQHNTGAQGPEAQ